MLFTPGHTVGGVSYVLEEKKCVFVGDTLFRRSIGRTDFSYGSYEDIISSIKNKLFCSGRQLYRLSGSRPRHHAG
ncbi:MAG: MBL fold metallo-hydrolase [Christensenellales bacterium]